MSRGLVCDGCGAVLKLQANGDDEHGEVAAWLTTTAGGQTWHTCTRSCLHELLDGEIREVVEEVQEQVAAVVRAIRAAELEDEEKGDES